MRVALLAIAALVLAGCTGARQKAAENAVAARAGVDDVSCTRTARVGYLQEIPTKVFICIARRAGGTRARAVCPGARARGTPCRRHGPSPLAPRRSRSRRP